ncbi:hypothetical protein CYMTET_9381 [Cymbomonas tetramitiformis]|uniref:Uncharacterized protein n=1 Tax=Cymbomonas tetramitiformis TaxID=36881 RepID=A0AAE0GRS6_9CHLO|nr:hypothetical protein CYMTET_9381 [Cymbomonas tetramitiformis]
MPVQRSRRLPVFGQATGEHFDKVLQAIANGQRDDALSPLGPPPPTDRTEGGGFINLSYGEDWLADQLADSMQSGQSSSPKETLKETPESVRQAIPLPQRPQRPSRKVPSVEASVKRIVQVDDNQPLTTSSPTEQRFAMVETAVTCAVALALLIPLLTQ